MSIEAMESLVFQSLSLGSYARWPPLRLMRLAVQNWYFGSQPQIGYRSTPPSTYAFMPGHVSYGV